MIQLDVHWEDHPNYPRLIAGISHNEIRLVLHKLREKEQFKFTTFDDVDDQVISEWTGLNRAQSALTRLHEASVSLIWRDSDERMAQFVARLNDLGLQFVHGARFWHVLDASAGKDQAANWLIEAYRRQWRARPLTLGLGDGPNDAPLLDVMDYAVVVKGLNRRVYICVTTILSASTVARTKGRMAGAKEWTISFPAPESRRWRKYGYVRTVWRNKAVCRPATATAQNHSRRIPPRY